MMKSRLSRIAASLFLFALAALPNLLQAASPTLVAPYRWSGDTWDTPFRNPAVIGWADTAGQYDGSLEFEDHEGAGWKTASDVEFTILADGSIYSILWEGRLYVSSSTSFINPRLVGPYTWSGDTWNTPFRNAAVENWIPGIAGTYDGDVEFEDHWGAGWKSANDVEFNMLANGSIASILWEGRLYTSLTISNPDNRAPVIHILDPGKRDRLKKNQDVTMSLEVSDPDANDGISRIEVYIGKTLVAAANEDVSEITFRPTGKGAETLHVVAYDYAGKSAKASVKIRVR